MRGYAIDPAIQGDAGLLRPIAPVLIEPRVVVDLARAECLTRESDELREILLAGSVAPEPAPTLPVEVRPRPHDAIPRLPEAGLPADWAELASKLADHQVEALRALMAEAGSAVRLRQIAEQHAIMPERLIDSINELALDAIGDCIIEPGSHPPVIEDEYLDRTRKLVTSHSERLA